MIVIVGLVVLLVAVIVGFMGVLTNAGPDVVVVAGREGHHRAVCTRSRIHSHGFS